MMVPLSRCASCRYALVNGVCPVCQGRQAGERLPMLAPLPKAKEAERKPRRFAFPKRRRAKP